MADGPLGFALEWILVAALMFAAGLPRVRAWFVSPDSAVLRLQRRIGVGLLLGSLVLLVGPLLTGRPPLPPYLAALSRLGLVGVMAGVWLLFYSGRFHTSRSETTGLSIALMSTLQPWVRHYQLLLNYWWALELLILAAYLVARPVYRLHRDEHRHVAWLAALFLYFRLTAQLGLMAYDLFTASAGRAFLMHALVGIPALGLLGYLSFRTPTQPSLQPNH